MLEQFCAFLVDQGKAENTLSSYRQAVGDYMKWYDAYDSFLKHNGFAKAFPTVDDLTRAMGNVAFYYQGRVIENIRISNTVDAYAVNGWESMKLENFST